MPKRGGKRKKTRTQLVDAKMAPPKDVKKQTPSQYAKEEEAKDAPPRSMAIVELCGELRRVMAPNTAERLREKPSNTLKDFVHAASPLGVTHLMMLTQRDQQVNLRIARVPAGPTLSFKVDEFVLMKNVRALQKRPFDTAAAYQTAPLVVMNNFGAAEEPHVKLMRITFEAMFAPIDVTTVKLADCRRVVLVQRREDGFVEVRHYAVRASAAGLSKSIKRVVEAKRLPDLSNAKDIAEYVTSTTLDSSGNYASDSEPEDDHKVVLPSKFVGRGNVAKHTSAIKLAELGPRLTLRLFKVQAGVCDGHVLYHAFQSAEEKDDAEDDDEDDDEEQRHPKAKKRSAMDNNRPRKRRRKEKPPADDR